MGIGLLQPTKPNDATSLEGVNGAFLPAATADRVWPCAKAVAEWLHSTRAPPLIGRSVLELGSGCGLAGFAAWKAGATRVCLSELPENLARLEQLVAANECGHVVSTAALDWTQQLPPALATHWDVVVAADCVFWPGLFGPLLATMAALGAQPGASPRFILSMVDRLGRAKEFSAMASEAGWELQRLEQDCNGEKAILEARAGGKSLLAMQRESCELYELRRRPDG